MNRVLFPFVLALGFVHCSGCRRTPAPSATPDPGPQPKANIHSTIPDPAKTSFDEMITLEVQGDEGLTFSKSMGQVGANLNAAAGKNRLETKEGRVLANGKDGGQLKARDKVLLDKVGRLFVNGEERKTK